MSWLPWMPWSEQAPKLDPQRDRARIGLKRAVIFVRAVLSENTKTVIQPIVIGARYEGFARVGFVNGHRGAR